MLHQHNIAWILPISRLWSHNANSSRQFSDFNFLDFHQYYLSLLEMISSLDIQNTAHLVSLQLPDLSFYCLCWFFLIYMLMTPKFISSSKTSPINSDLHFQLSTWHLHFQCLIGIFNWACYKQALHMAPQTWANKTKGTTITTKILSQINNKTMPMHPFL